MGVSGQSPTSHRGYSRLEQMNAINIDSDDLPSDTRKAQVVIVGRRPHITSHWASLWIFDDGMIWSVELSAVDRTSGARWVSNNYSMKLLVADVKEEGDHNSVRVRQQVRETMNRIWPSGSAETREFLFFIDAVLSTDDPKQEFQTEMDCIWPTISETDVKCMAKVLLLTFGHFAGLQEDSASKMAGAADFLWPQVDFQATKEAFERAIHSGEPHKNLKNTIERALESSYLHWPDLSNKQRERIEHFFGHLVDTVQSGEECRKCFREALDILWQVDPSCSRRLAERLLLKYLDDFGYEILDTDGPISLRTSLSALRKAAEENPMIGSRYDLLFNNCQLYLIHLLYVQYDVDGTRLPWNIGALVAGPVMLFMEVVFIAVFSRLSQLRMPVLTCCFALSWIAVEVCFAFVYALRTNSGLFAVLGATILTFLWVVFPSTSVLLLLPSLSLMWDLTVVMLAGTANRVHRDGGLILLNTSITALCSGACFLILWHCGWPIESFLDTFIQVGLLVLMTFLMYLLLRCWIALANCGPCGAITAIVILVICSLPVSPQALCAAGIGCNAE